MENGCSKSLSTLFPPTSRSNMYISILCEILGGNLIEVLNSEPQAVQLKTRGREQGKEG